MRCVRAILFRVPLLLTALVALPSRATVLVPTEAVQANPQVRSTELNAEAPTLVRIDPPPGQVDRLDTISITFSQPVTGLAFSDLLLNGRPAIGLTGSGAIYTFTVEPPPYGAVAVTWDEGTVVTDLASPPNRFDPAAPGATWTYERVDTTPPAVTQITPAPGNTVRVLSQLEVLFSEPVTGLEASDVRFNGRPALSLSGTDAGPYIFVCPALEPGPVEVTWAEDHDIRDEAAPPNAFAGGRWQYTLDPALGFQPVRLNEFLTAYSGDDGLRDEDNELQDWIELHNPGTSPVNLRGWSLTDDADRPDKWVFPDTLIPDGGYVVVFASAKDRRPTVPGARLHTNFKLASDGEYLALFTGDSPRLVASAFDPSYSPQRPDYSYGYDPADRLRHFQRPTPGTANGVSSIDGVVPPVAFNVQRGLFDHPFELLLSSALDGAEIRYTTDGNEPGATTGRLYTAALAITTTTVVRAVAFAPNRLPSVSVTHTYVFPALAARQPPNPPGVPAQWIDTQGRAWTADYGMDPEIADAPAYRDRLVSALKSLPALSIVTRPADMFDNGNGIYPKSQARGPAWERPASVEFIDPARGQTMQANCGVQMQGNSVRDPVKTAKHAFRLVFKGDYGPAKLRYRVFPDAPLDEFDTLTIRADFNNSWMHWSGEQRPRGQRVRDAWMKESQRALGGLASHNRFFHLYLNGLYWGVYDATERPDAAFAASYLGGAKQDFDVVNEGQLVDGTMAAYNTMRNLSGVETDTGYNRMKQYLDVTAYIDYLLLHFYAGHEDWFTDKNWYASRRRATGAGFRYQSWDGELMLNAPSRNIVTRNDQPTGLHSKMLSNSQYRLDFADRVHRHFFNEGALTPAAAAERYDRWASLIEPAMIAESARWGDYRRDVHPYSSGPYELYTADGHFANERNRLMKSYFPVRTDTVLNQLKAAGLYPADAVAPVFSPHGGRVTTGFELTMTVPRGTIYYTTDGSDPRQAPGGAVSPAALRYDRPVPLVQTRVIKARTLIGNTWSALNEATFVVGAPTAVLEFAEIHYHPVGGEPYEFIEFLNPHPTAVDVSGFSLEGVQFVFPPGSILAPGQTVLLASGLAPTAFASRHPDVTVFGWFTGTLDNGGERLSLLDRQRRTVTSVTYNDRNGWPRAADGSGPSLERIDFAADPDAPAAWQASRMADGTPGVPVPPIERSPVRLSEFLAHGQSSTPGESISDWIELENFGTSDVDLTGWSLSDGSDPVSFVFPTGTVLPSGGFLIVPCAPSTVASDLVAPFALDRDGETLSLFDDRGIRVDAVTFGHQLPNLTLGRWGDDHVWKLCQPTPGAPNVPQPLASSDRLTINEWLADPLPGEPDWIEIHHRDTDLPAALGGLYLATADRVFRLRAFSFVEPRGYHRFFADEQSGSGRLDFRLPAAGGSIALLDATGATLERVSYGPQTGSVSQGRLPDGGSTIVSFPLSQSPGAPNHLPSPTGLRLNEVLAWPLARTAETASPRAGWVEVFNPQDITIDLVGMSLVMAPTPTATSGGTSPTWRFPAGSVLHPRSHALVVFDPARPATVVSGPDGWNTGFSLARRGGQLRLLDRTGLVADAVVFGHQAAGLAIGRSGSAGDWQPLEPPTPGAPNALPATLGSPADLRINEWLALPSSGGDWVELFNPGARPVALAALQLTDDPSIAGVGKYVFAPLSFIGPQAFVQVLADRRVGDGPDHADFEIAGAGEAVLLLDPAGRALDAVYFGRQQPGISLGRYPDGADAPFKSFDRPTPEAANGTSVAPPPPPVLELIALTSGTLRLRVHGESGPVYELHGSPDMDAWEVIEVSRPPAVPFDWVLPLDDAPSHRFFRVRIVP